MKVKTLQWRWVLRTTLFILMISFVGMTKANAYNEDESDSEKLKKLVKELGKQGVRNLLDLVKDGLGTKTTSESGSIKIEELPNTGLEYIEMPATQQQEEAQEPAA